MELGAFSISLAVSDIQGLLREARFQGRGRYFAELADPEKWNRFLGSEE